jgi:hypothetical protein
MAFATFAAVNSGTDTTGATSHSIALPTGISAGDLLLVFVVTDGNPTLSGTLTTEYTPILNTTSGTAVRLAIYAKSASGSEGSTVALTTSASEAACFRSARIAAARWKGGTITAAVEVASATGSSVNPNPPSLNPTNWDVEDTLWIAGQGCDGNRATTGYSSGYSSNQYTTTVSNAANGCGIALATLESATASQDPGTLTINSADDWVAFTLAIRANPLVTGAFTSGDGVSTASSMAGASTAATAFTSADGVSTASTMAGDTVAAGRPSMPIGVSRLTSSRHSGRAAGTFTPRMIVGEFSAAAGVSTAGALSGAAPGEGNFVAAAGTSTAGSLEAQNISGGSRDMPLRISRATSSRHGGRAAGSFTPRMIVGSFAPAGGSSVVSSLVGSGNGSANFTAAAGVTTAGPMNGSDVGAARSLGRVSRSSGLGWTVSVGGAFNRVNGAVMVAAEGLSTSSTMATSLTWITGFSVAAGTSTAGTLAGSSATAAAMTAAAGTSTTSMVGGGITSLTAAVGTSTTSMVGSAVAAATMSEAAGVSSAQTLAGSGIAVASFSVAAGTSTAGALYGSDSDAVPQVGVFVTADGVSAPSDMAGASTAATAFVAAAGASTGGTLLPSTVTSVTMIHAEGVGTTSDMVGTNAGGTVVAGAFVSSDGATVCSDLAGSKTSGAWCIAAEGLTAATSMAGRSTAASSMSSSVGVSAGVSMIGADANNGIASMTMTAADGTSTTHAMHGKAKTYPNVPPGHGGRPRNERGRRPATSGSRRTTTGNTSRN